MSFTIMSEEYYAKSVEEGTQICHACGQHNSKEQHGCWYCGASSKWLSSMEKSNAIHSSPKVPKGKDFMIVDSWSDFDNRVSAMSNV